MSKNKNVKKNKIEIDEVENDELELEEEFDDEEFETEEDDDFGKKKTKKKVEVEDDDDEEEYVELSLEDRVSNIEKKTNTTLIVSVITVILVSVSMILSISNGSKNDTDRTSSNTPTTNTNSGTNTNTAGTYDTSAFDEISATQIATESKGKPILIMIGRQGCGFCAQYVPTLEALQQTYDFKTKYIDFSKIVEVQGSTAYISDTNAYEKLIALTGTNYKGWVEENFGSTPLTLIIKDNKILYAEKGGLSQETLIEQFKKVGINEKK